MPELAEPIDCQAAMQRLWDYLDGALPPPSHAALQAHLAACAPCAEHADFEERFLVALARAHAGDVAAQALRHRVLTVLRDEGFRAPSLSL